VSGAQVKVSLDGGVAHVILQRPEVANAIDLATARELRDVVGELASDDAVRVVLLTGAGARFCGGGDVAAMMAAEDREAYVVELAEVLDEATRRLHDLRKPVVAAVQGAVAGAGLSLMLSCDLIVAERSTRFVTAYAGIGLTPDVGLSYLLPRAVGQQRALELLLCPRTLDAEEAEDWGLVTAVVDDGDAAGRAAEIAGRLSTGPAGSYGLARGLVRDAWESTRAEAGRRETEVIGRAVRSRDAQTLMARFAR
jgi:2-(1,2-epoxy-1,2-dihydrophenyl)acetyl-CoA isomerase